MKKERWENTGERNSGRVLKTSDDFPPWRRRQKGRILPAG